jgi:Type II CAAX prenyl endopeptidase Rce1-like
MPPEDELRSQRNGRLILILRYIILGAYILYAARRNSLPYSALGIYFRHFFPLTLIGVVAGLLFLSLRRLATTVWPALAWNNSTSPITRGPVSIWVVIILIGGNVEELWRAFCLVRLQNEGLQTAFVILLTSGVFAASQLGGKPSRISGKLVEVYSTVAIGIGLAILFLRFNSFLLVASANITYYLAALYFTRTRG